jgi:hypothetical protein
MHKQLIKPIPNTEEQFSYKGWTEFSVYGCNMQFSYCPALLSHDGLERLKREGIREAMDTNVDRENYRCRPYLLIRIRLENDRNYLIAEPFRSYGEGGHENSWYDKQTKLDNSKSIFVSVLRDFYFYNLNGKPIMLYDKKQFKTVKDNPNKILEGLYRCMNEYINGSDEYLQKYAAFQYWELIDFFNILSEIYPELID